MNPQAFAAIAAAVPRPSPSTTNTVLKIGVVSIGLYFGYKWYKKQQENKANADVTHTPAANSAQLLRGFMNPSGVSWMRNFDGTKTAEILTEARNIADLTATQKYYRDMFDGADLLEDLRQELNADDYTKFITTVKNNRVVVDKNGNKTVDPASLVYNLYFLSNKATALYSKSAGTFWSKQTVQPFQYLPLGSKNTDISKITVRETTNPLFGGYWYATKQQVNGVWREVYVKKDDFTLVADWTLTQGIKSKKYSTIKIDGAKF